MPEFHPLLQAAIVILGPTGAAWVGVRTALNGTRQNVKDLASDMREVRKDLTDVRERVARLEGKGMP